MCADMVCSVPEPLSATAPALHIGAMENFALDYEFDRTRPFSDELGYGDGSAGEVQRRQLERKYTITRKPLSDIDHPEGKLGYVAAVQMYYPGLTEDEALNWLLDNTAYPFETLQTIRQVMRRAWFESLDKAPYETLLDKLCPQLDSEMQQLVLIRALEPATEDAEVAIMSAAEPLIRARTRAAELRALAAARDAEAQQKWEEDTEAREARRAARTLSRARERVANAEQELDRARAKVADLESLVPGKLD